MVPSGARVGGFKACRAVRRDRRGRKIPANRGSVDEAAPCSGGEETGREIAGFGQEVASVEGVAVAERARQSRGSVNDDRRQAWADDPDRPGAGGEIAWDRPRHVLSALVRGDYLEREIGPEGQDQMGPAPTVGLRA